MTRRFQHIKNGQRYNEALTRYKQWVDESFQRLNDGVGTGKAKPPLIRLAIQPFGIDAGDEAALVNVTQTAREALTAAVGARATQTIPAESRRFAGFSPARIVAFTGSGSSTVETSQITGMKYLKYGGSSFTHPFGQNNTEREFDAYNAIAGAFLGAGPNRRTSYKPEVFRQS